jgi:hypothetical protein
MRYAGKHKCTAEEELTKLIFCGNHTCDKITPLQEASTMTSLQIVSLPTAIDVLCGSGQQEKRHSGNIVFHQVVSQFTEEYSQATLKRVKMQITKNVFDILTASGVRFLKKCSVYKMWYVGSSKVGRDKIGHFLRFNRPCANIFSKQQQQRGAGKTTCCGTGMPKLGIMVSKPLFASSAISPSMVSGPAVSTTITPTVVVASPFAKEKEEMQTENTGRSTPSALSADIFVGENDTPAAFCSTSQPATSPLISYNHVTLVQEASNPHQGMNSTAAAHNTLSSSCPSCDVPGTVAATMTTTTEELEYYTSLLASLPPAAHHQSSAPPSRITSSSSFCWLLQEQKQQEHHSSTEDVPLATKQGDDNEQGPASAALFLLLNSTANTSISPPEETVSFEEIMKMVSPIRSIVDCWPVVDPVLCLPRSTSKMLCRLSSCSSSSMLQQDRHDNFCAMMDKELLDDPALEWLLLEMHG